MTTQVDGYSMGNSIIKVDEIEIVF